MSVTAELKREEEKAKGVNHENGTENPDIVPFEDNEEEEEEESEEEDEEIGQGFEAQGRGRGRGMMWPPHMTLSHGARPFPGRLPPNMMGGDGFSYGPINPDNFPMAGPFGMGPRGFVGYGPRFSGEFAGGPNAGMMFPGRPSGFGGMMMGGGGRGPMVGMSGSGAVRGGRPVGMGPFSQAPLQNSQRGGKRENDGGGGDGDGLNQGRGQEMMSDEGGQRRRGEEEDRYDESESEEEKAPRRSRHKRRSMEAAE